jgi:Spy/CpxP family protein refolding chaperone
MGLARAAELNHYPGPKHVLAHAGELQLTPDQRSRTQEAFDRMHADAVALGSKLVDAERELDALFSGGKADRAKLGELVSRVATLQGEVRLAHLSAHLAMRDILTPAQIAQYDRLRGYTDPPATNRTSR